MADQQSFQILSITAHSDHPIRNSAGELIFGNHLIWEGPDNANDDGEHGSSAPNVFSYDFTSPLASNSLLNITIKVVVDHASWEGTDYRLHGLLNSSKVFESDVFNVGSAETVVVVVARVVEPHHTPAPLSLSGDFTWSMESDRKLRLVCAYPDKTRLELYWISTDIHEIFLSGLSGIRVDFLRCAVNKIGVSNQQSLAEITQSVFSGYSKSFDTVEGSPHFGVSYNGGTFDYSYYIAFKPPGPKGSLQPIVNCYDQAAMTQLIASLGPSKLSWLFLNPNGYINTTHLVGVPQNCNSPFFNRTNPPLPPLIGVNDKRRTAFKNHAFNGVLSAYGTPGDRIYDACGGPHLGTESPAAYVQASVDSATNLYQLTHTQHGTAADIVRFQGVTSRNLYTAPTRDESTMSESKKNLLHRATVRNNANLPYSQAPHWADVSSEWAKVLLGEGCTIAFQDTTIGSGVAKTLCHLTDVAGVDGGGDVVVRVTALTRTTTGGDGTHLDIDQSSRAALDTLLSTLTDTQLDLGPNDERLDTLWAPAPAAFKFGSEIHVQHALRYAANVPRGRFLLVSGNFMIDISGGSSSAALEPVARRLLTHWHTTVDIEHPSLGRIRIPAVTRSAYHIPAGTSTSTGGTEKEKGVVKGIGAAFDVECEVDALIKAGSADVEGHGVLLSKCLVERDSEAGGRTSTVTFTFVTRAVGTHDVDLRFMEALTMNVCAKRIRVTVVVDAEGLPLGKGYALCVVS